MQSSFVVAAGVFDADEDYGADGEIDDESGIFAEKMMARGVGQVRHEQVVDGVAGKNGDERIEEVAPHPTVGCLSVRLSTVGSFVVHCHFSSCESALTGQGLPQVSPSLPLWKPAVG
jgi:hypothetical protein